VVNGKIYVVGGANTWPGAGGISTVEIYDPATDTWTMEPDMPRSTWGSSSSVVNGRIYVFGGNLHTIQEYDRLLATRYQPQSVDAQRKLITLWGQLKVTK
jgi:N-acetylneuraminic acid mutarotase